MPGRDGTGPIGQGPRRGRFFMNFGGKLRGCPRRSRWGQNDLQNYINDLEIRLKEAKKELQMMPTSGNAQDIE